MIKSTRAHPRFEVDAHVDVAAAEVLPGQTVLNLSLGGICIRTPSLQEVGTKVDVTVNFPDLGTSMALRGQVVWVSREPPAEVGLRWLDLDDDRRELLRKFIALVQRSRA